MPWLLFLLYFFCWLLTSKPFYFCFIIIYCCFFGFALFLALFSGELHIPLFIFILSRVGTLWCMSMLFHFHPSKSLFFRALVIISESFLCPVINLVYSCHVQKILHGCVKYFCKYMIVAHAGLGWPTADPLILNDQSLNLSLWLCLLWTLPGKALMNFLH